jgi:hypothetical protein
MEAQHMHDDVFRHHRVAAWRLDLAERNLRQPRMVDERLDAGRAAEHRLQFWEDRQRIEIGMHEGEVFDIRQLAGIGPDADFQIGELLREGFAPRRRVADTLVEFDDKQRHIPSEHSACSTDVTGPGGHARRTSLKGAPGVCG